MPNRTLISYSMDEARAFRDYFLKGDPSPNHYRSPSFFQLKWNNPIELIDWTIDHICREFFKDYSLGYYPTRVSFTKSRRMVLFEPLIELPRYLNSVEPVVWFIEWRLKLGK